MFKPGINKKKMHTAVTYVKPEKKYMGVSILICDQYKSWELLIIVCMKIL